MKRKLIIVWIIILLSLIIFARKLPELLQEADFYVQLKNNYIQCELCPNYCIVEEGATGTCGVRQNIDGKFYSLVYNKPVAIHVDPIEKKPLYHFHPGTNILSLATVGCNLRCIFCQNWTISQSRPEDTQPYNMPPERIIKMAKDYGCESIAFTYTEPTVFYEYMYDIAKLAKENNMKTVWVTCGYINEEPLRKLAPYIDAANIDLKGFSDEFYETYTTGSLQPVLHTLKLAKELGMLFEITNLVIPDANDNEDEIREMCLWIKTNLGDDIPLHFTRFFPHYKLANRPATPLSTLKRAYEIAREVGIKYVYIGNVVGEADDTVCPECGKEIIKRSGYQIKENHIKEGKCEFCGAEIYGEFE